MSTKELERRSSVEAQIDRQSETLIGRMVQGTASEEDVVKYRELSADRASRMIKIRMPTRAKAHGK